MSLHLIKSKSLYLHIPKTGGTWIEEALKASGVEAEYAKAIEGVTWKHSLISHYAENYEFVFTFVRHPISWYESWWKFQTVNSWIEHEPEVWHPQRALAQCASDNFSKFIQLCIEREPAYVSRMYEWYIGPPGCEFVNFVGRYERLVHDLVQALRLLSEGFDEGALRMCPPANVSSSSYGEPVWDEGLKAQVLALEAAAIKRYYGDGWPLHQDINKKFNETRGTELSVRNSFPSTS